MATFFSYAFPGDAYDAIVEAQGKLGELEENCQVNLNGFDKTFAGRTKAFYVGDDQTLETILSQLNEAIGVALTNLNTYLGEVDGFMTTVTNDMYNDQQAYFSAWEAYNAIANCNTDLMTDEEKAANTQKAEEAGEKIWIDNRCDLWG